ncbi:hypothetical protein ACFXPN_42500 [Streptomyces griseorubiginosus]|uniref:hypothetical protein n=1 Tax=Streptomyces griseorubiginosus TaxID=67304 RepID=UPI003686B0A2
MRIRTAAAVTTVLVATLVGCSSTNEPSEAKATPTPSSKPSVDIEAAEKAAGIPAKPTGAERAALLRALAAANPDVVKDEEKAIDAARNQCSALNGGAQKVDWLASQRFSYGDVTTSEAQGKQINAALKGLGFCKV